MPERPTVRIKFPWTLVGNARALRFYRAHGFAADGARQTFAVGGVDLPEPRGTLGADTSG